ncbi:MAG: radical SAM protein [Chloroflexia bacterium]|nr:radical SAM protein [Chloroflexia bacterium]
MKILLVSTNQVKGFRAAMPIGMIAIASAAKKNGHTLHCIDLCFENRSEEALKKEILGFNPDIIGFSIRNIDNQNFLDPSFILPPVRRYIKLSRKWKADTKIVVGGPAFTLMPDEMIKYLQADYGIVGPGEKNFIELLHKLGNNEDISDIPGLITYIGKETHLLPVDESYLGMEYLNADDINLYDEKYYSYYFNGPTPMKHVAFPIMGKRGCVYSCIYCANSLIAGTKIKLKPPSEVVDDIEAVIRHNKAKYFEFVDGAFNAPYSHALEICREMKKRKINHPWLCMFNPGNATEELLDLMAETGCKVAELGTECGSDIILRRLKKHFTVQKIKETHKMLTKRGIKAEHCVFLGSPGETEETLNETFNLLEELVPNNAQTINRVFISLGYRIFRGTELYDIAIEEKVISENDSLLLPKFYVNWNILNNDKLLDLIEHKVHKHTNWYLWWGFSRYTLREQIQQVKAQYKGMENAVVEALKHPCNLNSSEQLIKVQNGIIQ